jgi:hypothetical protein
MTCFECEASGLCESADEHREKEGYSKIGVNSKECKECKEKYAESHASSFSEAEGGVAVAKRKRGL